jgi:hypothetical protein
MSEPSRSSRPSLDFPAIRREAEAAAREFLENRRDAYLEKIREVEALPENQSGADNTWVDLATAARRRHYRNTIRVS